MSKEYAVVELNTNNYKSLANAIVKDFSAQISTRLTPSVTHALNTFIYNLFDKISDETYASRFDEILEKSVTHALSNPEIKISEEQISQLRTEYSRLVHQMYTIQERAAVLQNTLNNIQMSGASNDICALDNFIKELATSKFRMRSADE